MAAGAVGHRLFQASARETRRLMRGGLLPGKSVRTLEDDDNDSFRLEIDKKYSQPYGFSLY